MVGNSGSDVVQFRVLLALRQHRGSPGGAERHHSSQGDGGYARFQYDELHGNPYLHHVRRVRTAQGPAERVFHLPAAEKDTHPPRQGAGSTDRYPRYAETQYHLCTEFREQCLRQQRRESAQRFPLRLLHRSGDRLHVHVGIYGRCLQKGQCQEDAHLLLRCGRFGFPARAFPAACRPSPARFASGIRFDRIQCQTRRYREGREQRYLYRPEPETDRLPGICHRGYQRQSRL